MQYKIINAISSDSVPLWGNKKLYIAIHYLGVVGQSHELASDGTGAHYYIYWDRTIYQRCAHDAVVWNIIRGGPACGEMPYEPGFLMIRGDAGSVRMAGKEAEKRTWHSGGKYPASL